MQRIGVQFAAVQERYVAGVDAAFHGLQLVALLLALSEVPMRRRHVRPFERRQRRLQIGRPHIGPDHAAALDAR